jgi:hypothetical protein
MVILDAISPPNCHVQYVVIPFGSFVCVQVLVNSLANSKTFQRFAIRSNAMFTDMAKKTAEQHSTLTQTSADFMKTFREEVRRVYKLR